MIHRIRYLFLFLALFWVGVSGALAAEEPEPVILTATAAGKNINEAMFALYWAVAGHNYSFVRQQAIDSRLVPYGQEVRSVRVFYFCNMERMDRTLRLDPRAAQMIPYRVTLVETPTGVDMMAVNPAWIAQNLGNSPLRADALELKRDYLSILDEATL